MSRRAPARPARCLVLEQRTLLASPIIITQGGTYSGTWESLDPHMAAVTIQTSEPVIIENSVIRSRGDCIASGSGFQHTKITVRNTSAYGLNPNELGRAPGRFFDVELFDSADIENNYLENTAGIYMLSYAGDHTAGQTIKVLNNKAKNIDGRKSNGAGGWLDYNTRSARKRGGAQDGMELVQFLQFDKVQNLPGIDIAWNEVVNEPGNSRVEDNINIYLSSGTQSSPMLIHDNYIQGAYTIKPWQGDTSDGTYNYDWSFSGGGILIGDGVGSTLAADPAYIKAFDNQVVSTTNYGIAIAAGHDMEFYNNRIVSCGLLADGRTIANQNVGAYVWDSYSAGSKHFYNNSGHDNLVGWVQGSGRNDWWSPDFSTLPNNTHWPGPITLATEAAEYALWQQKLSAHQLHPPATPQNLQATSGGIDQIHLSWDDVSTESGYKVERSLNGIDGWSPIWTSGADGVTYNDIVGLSPGTTYYYRVRATNAAGDSDFSSVANATTDFPVKPGAPTDLVATAAGSFRINLVWIDNADNETRFRVERSGDGVSGWTPIATPAKNATSYSDANALSPATQYFYQIVATNLAGDSDLSNLADATTAVLTAPAAPSGLVAKAISSSQIDLLWADNADNESGFIVERSPDGINDWALLASPAENATGYSDKGLAELTNYYYRVRATNVAGDSNNSDVAGDTTPLLLVRPAPPSQLLATARSTTRIDLAWQDNSGNESGFRVERSLNGATGWTEIATPGENATGYNDSTGLSTGTKYFYRVRATNAAGDSDFTAAASAITYVPTSATYIATGATWKYLDNGSDQGATWRGTSFNDSTWKSGAAQLGYGDGDEATVVSYGPNASSKYVTTYFRKSFSVADPSLVSALNLRVLRDDGAVVYLNGTEVFRSNMPTGPIVYNTFASSTVEDSTFYAWTINPALLVGGNNVIAVEIHQSDLASSDISFDFDLKATVAAPAIVPSAPSALAAGAVSSSRIDLTWADNSNNESGFIVERSLDGLNGWTSVKTTAANVTAFSDTGLSTTTKYFYRVKAFAAAGDSAYSNTASTTTLPPPPAAPTALTVQPLSRSSIKLTWADNSGNETGFKIERSLDGINWTQVATVGANTTTYTNTGLNRSTKYYYRVVAYNTGGNSLYSNVASATTPRS